MVIYSVFDIFTIFYEAKLQITILPAKSSAEKHHSPAIYSLPRTYEEPILWLFSFYHGLDGLDGFEPIEPLEPLSLSLEARQKPDKPLGEDGGRCPCCHASALVL